MNWFVYGAAVPGAIDWPGEAILVGIAFVVLSCLGTILVKALLVGGSMGQRVSPSFPVLVRPRAMASYLRMSTGQRRVLGRAA